MPIKKIADVPQPCIHPEHYFPNMIVLPPGIYEHSCPACGATQIVHIPMTRCTMAGTRTSVSGHVISDVPQVPKYREDRGSTACSTA